MSRSFTVATFNIGDYHPEAERLPEAERRRGEPPIGPVAEIVRGLSADYVMLQEVPSQAYLRALAEGARHGYSEFREFFGSSGPGLGFLSRYPIGPVSLDLDWPQGVMMGAAAVQSVAAGRSVVLCNVHLPPVEKTRDDEGYVRVGVGELARILYRELAGETERSRGVDALVDGLRSVPSDAVVVGGDFNTVFLAKAIRSMRKQFFDSVQSTPSFFRRSYSKIRTILPARVDYLFYRDSLAVEYSTIVHRTAGDHYPVVATFAHSR